MRTIIPDNVDSKVAEVFGTKIKQVKRGAICINLKNGTDCDMYISAIYGNNRQGNYSREGKNHRGMNERKRKGQQPGSRPRQGEDQLYHNEYAAYGSIGGSRNAFFR